MKIAITGSKGTVGRALLSQFESSQFEVTEIDLPEQDVSNLDQLTEITKGHDAIIHLAWDTNRDNVKTGTIDPINNKMTFNAYQAALVNRISRVVMASSNHAHRHDVRDSKGKITSSINPPIPDSPYGAQKVFMEALGRYYAYEHKLQVVCIRIGGINKEDKPTNEIPYRWISHADFGRLVASCLVADRVPDNFQIVYGVGLQDVFDWSNPFSWQPLDRAY